jgi:hypothetical protein
MNGDAHFEACGNRCSGCRCQAARKRADVRLNAEPSMPKHSYGIIDFVDHL